MTEEEKAEILAESRATIARIDKMLDRQSLPPLPPTEDRGLRWRKEAAEAEAARVAETERRQQSARNDRTRAIAQAIVDAAVAADRETRIDEMSELVAVLREETADQIAALTERINKMEAAEAARSFDRAVAKAGSVIDLPHKRVVS
jgi:hypothetical protein